MGESSSQSYWDSIDRRHRALIALGAGVLAVVAIVIVFLLTGEPGPDATPETAPVITPAEQTEEPTAVIPSYPLTPTADASAAATPGGPGTGASAAGPGETTSQPAALIAYRRAGALCVAGEDGSGERAVVPLGSGVFALSPDRTMIAAVDDSGVLWLHTLEDGQSLRIGQAEPDAPVWAPDSSWLVYTAPGPKVMRVNRGGTDVRALMTGRMPSVAADGRSVVAVSPASREPAVLVWRGTGVARHAVSVPITAVACDGERIYLGTAPSGASGATLRSITLAGTGDRVLVGGSQDMRDASFVSIIVSPDGTWLAYACHGDDGRSELYALQLGETDPIRISGRRDSYPLQWAASGEVFYLIEGNALQGEATSLVSVALPSGTRRLVVSGASR